jgi:hypothetical protein
MIIVAKNLQPLLFVLALMIEGTEAGIVGYFRCVLGRSCCPSPNAATYCTTDYDPVICYEHCTYTNTCQADSAGYDADKDCKSAR